MRNVSPITAARGSRRGHTAEGFRDELRDVGFAEVKVDGVATSQVEVVKRGRLYPGLQVVVAHQAQRGVGCEVSMEGSE